MSQENVELVRASFDVWNTGDMDAYGELLDPDVTSHTPEGWPEPGRSSAAKLFWLSSGETGMPGTTATSRSRSAISWMRGIVWQRAGCGVAAVTGPGSRWSRRASGRCATARSADSSSSGITARPSKPPGCRRSPEVVLWTKSGYSPAVVLVHARGASINELRSGSQQAGSAGMSSGPSSGASKNVATRTVTSSVALKAVWTWP